MYRTIERCLCFPFTFSNLNDWKNRQVQVSFNITNNKKHIEFSIHINIDAVNLRNSEHSVQISYSQQRRIQLLTEWQVSVHLRFFVWRVFIVLSYSAMTFSWANIPDWVNENLFNGKTPVYHGKLNCIFFLPELPRVTTTNVFGTVCHRLQFLAKGL